MTERYGEHLFSPQQSSEKERLQLMAEVLDPATCKRLEGLPLSEERRCLELGAGTGSVAQWLVLRSESVIATDVDTRFLAGDYEVLQHDVVVDDFPDASFDLVHARWLLCHLPQRDDVLRKIVRWLAPGGWLLLEEPASFPLESSLRPVYRKVSLAICALTEQRLGTDTHWARSFPEPLRQARLRNLALDVSVPVTGPGPQGRLLQLSAEGLVDQLQSAGVTEEEVREYALGVVSDQTPEFGFATVAAWGQKGVHHDSCN